jgi:NADPH:quinone reductase-like Zn-dependent oxidoreductase
LRNDPFLISRGVRAGDVHRGCRAGAIVDVLRQPDVIGSETVLLFAGGGSVGIVAPRLAVVRGAT